MYCAPDDNEADIGPVKHCNGGQLARRYTALVITMDLVSTDARNSASTGARGLANET
jgi:hypothetical protein